MSVGKPKAVCLIEDLFTMKMWVNSSIFDHESNERIFAISREVDSVGIELNGSFLFETQPKSMKDTIEDHKDQHCDGYADRAGHRSA